MIRDDILLRSIEQFAAAVTRAMLGRTDNDALAEATLLDEELRAASGLGGDVLEKMSPEQILTLVGFPDPTSRARLAFIAWGLYQRARLANDRQLAERAAFLARRVPEEMHQIAP